MTFCPGAPVKTEQDEESLQGRKSKSLHIFAFFFCPWHLVPGSQPKQKKDGESPKSRVNKGLYIFAFFLSMPSWLIVPVKTKMMGNLSKVEWVRVSMSLLLFLSIPSCTNVPVKTKKKMRKVEWVDIYTSLLLFVSKPSCLNDDHTLIYCMGIIGTENEGKSPQWCQSQK